MSSIMGMKAAGGVGGHLHHAIGAALILFGKGHIGGEGELSQIDLGALERSGISVSMIMLVFLAGWTFISVRMVRTALM